MIEPKLTAEMIRQLRDMMRKNALVVEAAIYRDGKWYWRCTDGREIPAA